MKRSLAALIAALFLAGCTGSTPPDPASPPPAQEPSGLPTQVVGDARDVADGLEQRYQDMESMVP